MYGYLENFISRSLLVCPNDIGSLGVDSVDKIPYEVVNFLKKKRWRQLLGAVLITGS